MAKVSPLRIDTELGKLPLKDKGLEMIEFESPAELRRNQLEKLVAGFRLFSYFGYDEGVAGHITFEILNLVIIFGLILWEFTSVKLKSLICCL